MSQINGSQSLSVVGRAPSLKDVRDFVNGVPDDATLSYTLVPRDRPFDPESFTLTASWKEGR